MMVAPLGADHPPGGCPQQPWPVVKNDRPLAAMLGGVAGRQVGWKPAAAAQQAVPAFRNSGAEAEVAQGAPVRTQGRRRSRRRPAPYPSSAPPSGGAVCAILSRPGRSTRDATPLTNRWSVALLGHGGVVRGNGWRSAERAEPTARDVVGRGPREIEDPVF